MVKTDKNSLFCLYCGATRVFQVDGTYTYEDEYGIQRTKYELAHCLKCNNPLLVTYNSHVGSWDIEFDDSIYKIVYPISERELNFSLPKLVEESYKEAVNCERNQTWLASAVMIGRTLEAVCREFDERSKNIKGSLNKMYTEGILSQEFHNWANELRILRNIGAHPSKEQVAQQDVKETLDFLKSLLEIYYVIRPRMSAMSTRRNKT